MDLREPTGEFTLTMVEYEDNGNDDERGDWAAFRATASSRGFRGQTDFWVSCRDLESFGRALTALDAELRGIAELVCGVGTDEYLRFRVEPYGKSGRLIARAVIAEARGSQGQRVHADFLVLPNNVTVFRNALQQVVVQREGVARLVGDPEAAV